LPFKALVVDVPPQAAKVKRASGDKLKAVLFFNILIDTLC
jgi:hypothetical protein